MKGSMMDVGVDEEGIAGTREEKLGGDGDGKGRNKRKEKKGRKDENERGERDESYPYRIVPVIAPLDLGGYVGSV